MIKLKQSIIILLVLLVSAKAYSHPHIWVATDLTLLTQDTKITGLNVKWQFDYMYSAAFMLDNDLNKDGKLDEEEQEIIEEQVTREAIFRLRPFIMLYFNGVEDKKFDFENLSISYNEEKEQVEYEFDIKLKTQHEIAGHHKLAILDKEFYTGFEQSYNFGLPKGCSFDLEEDMTMTVYEGLINPEVYQVNCK